MINRKLLDRLPYPIAMILKEAIICVILFFFCHLFQNLIPPFVSVFVDNLAFDLSRFSDAIMSLNIGLIFAVFLSIFFSDNSTFIQDARQHIAFNQPLEAVIINSVLLCPLSSFLPKDVLTSWLVAICECVIIASNIVVMWSLVKLSRKGQKTSGGANNDR